MLLPFTTKCWTMLLFCLFLKQEDKGKKATSDFDINMRAFSALTRQWLRWWRRLVIVCQTPGRLQDLWLGDDKKREMMRSLVVTLLCLAAADVAETAPLNDSWWWWRRWLSQRLTQSLITKRIPNESGVFLSCLLLLLLTLLLDTDSSMSAVLRPDVGAGISVVSAGADGRTKKMKKWPSDSRQEGWTGGKEITAHLLHLHLLLVLLLLLP